MLAGHSIVDVGDAACWDSLIYDTMMRGVIAKLYIGLADSRCSCRATVFHVAGSLRLDCRMWVERERLC